MFERVISYESELGVLLLLFLKQQGETFITTLLILLHCTSLSFINMFSIMVESILNMLEGIFSLF